MRDEKMKAARIRIKSVLKDSEGGLQRTEQFYSGRMTERDGKHYVLYEEDAQSGLEGTKTTIKWEHERVLILRNGTVSHRQEFCRGYKDRSLYRTPYLELALLTETHYVHTYFLRGKWCLEIEYTLHHGDAPYGEMKLLIEIEEDA